MPFTLSGATKTSSDLPAAVAIAALVELDRALLPPRRGVDRRDAQDLMLIRPGVGGRVEAAGARRGSPAARTRARPAAAASTSAATSTPRRVITAHLPMRAPSHRGHCGMHCRSGIAGKRRAGRRCARGPAPIQRRSGPTSDGASYSGCASSKARGVAIVRERRRARRPWRSAIIAAHHLGVGPHLERRRRDVGRGEQRLGLARACRSTSARARAPRRGGAARAGSTASAAMRSQMRAGIADPADRERAAPPAASSPPPRPRAGAPASRAADRPASGRARRSASSVDRERHHLAERCERLLRRRVPEEAARRVDDDGDSAPAGWRRSSRS